MPLPLAAAAYYAGAFLLRTAATTAVRYAPTALNALRVGAKEAAEFIATKGAPAAAQAAKTVGEAAVHHGPTVVRAAGSAALKTTGYAVRHPIQAAAAFGAANYATDGKLGEAADDGAVGLAKATKEYAPAVAGAAVSIATTAGGAVVDGWQKFGGTAVERGVDAVIEKLPPGVVPGSLRAAMQSSTRANQPKPAGTQAAADAPASPAAADPAAVPSGSANTPRDGDEAPESEENGAGLVGILTGSADPKQAAAFNKMMSQLKEKSAGNSFAMLFGLLGFASGMSGASSIKGGMAKGAMNAALFMVMATVIDKMLLGGRGSQMVAGVTDTLTDSLQSMFASSAKGEKPQERRQLATPAPALPAPAPG